MNRIRAGEESLASIRRSVNELATAARAASQDNVLDDPGDGGAINVEMSGQCSISTNGAETRTVGSPTFAGQRLSIVMNVDGGNCVISVPAGFNPSTPANNRITMDDAGDFVILESFQIGGSVVWRLLHNNGCTLTTA